MTRKWTTITGVIAVTVLMLLVAPPVQSADKTTAITFGTSSLGSSGYNLSAGMATLVNKYVKDLEASVIPSGGTSATIMMIGRGERDFGFGGGYDIYMGYKGEGVFAKTGPQPVRLVGRFYTSSMTIIAQPDIKGVQDFKNKVFMYRRKPNQLWGLYGDALLNAYGLGENDVKAKFSVQTKEVVAGLKTGVVDVGLLAGGVPMSYVLQLMQVRDFNVIDAGEKITRDLSAKYPFMTPLTIPAGTYKNQPNDVHTMGYNMYLFVSKDTPDDIVYEVLKAVDTHLDEFQKIHPLAKKYESKSASENPMIPLHPGAIKYYKEIGVLD